MKIIDNAWSPFTLKTKETVQWMEKTNPKWSEKSV